MKMDYTHYNEDKQASQNMNANNKAKSMAREMIGDGQTPNLWFVTYGPYVQVNLDFGEIDSELIDGYDAEKDTVTSGPFTSYEDALDYYNEIDPDYHEGIGQVFIEDRLCGIVTEKYLQKIVNIDYSYVEHDDSKIFYKNK